MIKLANPQASSGDGMELRSYMHGRQQMRKTSDQRDRDLKQQYTP